MFDLSNEKGLKGLGDKALGVSAIGIPAAATYQSVAHANAANPKLSDHKVISRSTETGATTGAVDGAMLALLHRSKKTLGPGPEGLGKRLAIYGTAGALINGAIARHLARKATYNRQVRKS